MVIVFTITNALLAYMLWGPGARSFQPEIALRATQEREVQARLAKMGIAMRAELPPSGAELPLLRVAPPTPGTTSAVAERLQALAQAFQSDQGSVQVGMDGTVLFRPTRPVGGEVKLDSDSAVRDLAGRLVGEWKLNEVAELHMSRLYAPTPDLKIVEYVTRHEGRPLWSAYVQIAVGRRGVTWVSAFLPAVQGFRGAAKGVIPPTEALLRLTGHLQPRRSADFERDRPSLANIIPGTDAGVGREPVQVRIEEIALGYFAARPADAQAWDTVPVWRVTMDQGYVFYINAFTGELES